jgi:5,10-methylenetetrahydrofolate reductase
MPQMYGVEQATEMCARILESGASSVLHFYTMNRERSILAVLRNLGLIEADSKDRIG